MSAKDWADLDDNRIGPILKELAEAVDSTDDIETLRRVGNRLKFMSSSVHSLAAKKRKEERGY
ncbi:MAG: hypothetical protein Unbinned7865contig1001_14 [Prokaryotic dsDNA virus sp.]|nr:MAG: hypothetical protein Unbinned7865contig1001_14 [Prokaryotic dsDNA virus sp.]